MAYSKTREIGSAMPVLAAGIVVGWFCGALYAADPLSGVPANVAGVIVFPNLDASLKRLQTFGEKLDPSFKGYDPSSLEERFGVPAGSCDWSRPVCVILARPSFEDASAVLAFVPKDGGKVSGEEGEVRALDAASERSILLRGGYAYVSARRRALYMIRRTTPPASLAAALDGDESTMRSSADVFLHLKMPRWRDRIQPFVQLVSTMARLGVRSQGQQLGKDVKAEEALVGWAIDGAVEVVNQMDGLSVSAALEPGGVRLRHHHRFVPDGSVVAYLSRVTRGESDPWSPLPDRPFLMAVSTDWHVPAGSSLMARMTRRLFETEGCSTLNEEAQAKLLRETAACHGQMRGMNMMITSPSGRLEPMQVLGSYVFDDAEQGLRQMQTIQEYAVDAMSAFSPSGCVGKSTAREMDGVRMMEIRLDSDRLDPGTRSAFESMYGKNSYVRQAVAGRNRVVYALSERPDELITMLRPGNEARGLAANPDFKGLLAEFPKDANIRMVFDAGRAFAMVPRMLEISAAFSGEKQQKREAPATPPPGPWIGWCGTVHPRAFTGEVYCRTSDAVRIAEALRDTGRQFRRAGEAADKPAP